MKNGKMFEKCLTLYNNVCSFVAVITTKETTNTMNAITTRTHSTAPAVRYPAAYQGAQLPTLSDLKAAQMAYFAECGKSEKTVYAYGRSLSYFFDFCTRCGDSVPTRATIAAYVAQLRQDKKSDTTIKAYIAAVSALYKWLMRRGVVSLNIADEIPVKVQHNGTIKKHFTPDQCRELLEMAAADGARNFAIVSLMLRNGLRCVEVSRLNLDSVGERFGRRVLRVHGKGHTSADAETILDEKAAAALSEYLATRCGEPGAPMFVNADTIGGTYGQRLTPRSISRIFAGYIRRMGLNPEYYTAHSARHTTAVQTLKKTGNIYAVQQQLRHSSVKTSEIYLQSVNEEMRFNNLAAYSLDDIF